MSNCQKEIKSQNLLKYKPYQSNLSSLASEFLQRIQIQEEGLESEGAGEVGEQKCKITNMSHHRIHFQGKGSLIVNNLYSAVGVGGGGGGGGEGGAVVEGDLYE